MDRLPAKVSTVFAQAIAAVPLNETDWNPVRDSFLDKHV